MEGQSTVTPPKSPFVTPKRTVSLDSTATLVPPECPRKRRHEDTCYQGCDVPELTLHSPLLSINDSSFETPKLGLRPRLSSFSRFDGLEHDSSGWTWNEEVKVIFASVDHQVQPIKLFEEEEIRSTEEIAAHDDVETRLRTVSWSEDSGPPVDELLSPDCKRVRFLPGPNRNISLLPRKTGSLPLYPLPSFCFLPS